MRTIPKDDFPTDEIQRILRFIKMKEEITERDYLEAVELSGQILVNT